MSRTWSLDMSLLLLHIRIGAAYRITLTMIELVSMSLVLMLEYLKISFRTVKRKFTFDIIELTVAILSNPELINMPRTLIFCDCSMVYLLAWSLMWDVILRRLGLVIMRSLLLSAFMLSLFML